MSQTSSPEINEWRSEKVLAHHLERLAVVYVRQSTLQQVQKNKESTRLQYNLVHRAKALGWPASQILVIDEDLGKSAATAEGRSGFQRLVAEVSLDHVGLILGVDISRLARSSKDWHQLLEICALFKTLISDLDGIYDPSQYNDQLLLGLKGTFSVAESHTLKQRMQQGVLQKARRGELRFRLPTGYVHSPEGLIILDPDEQVQSVIRLVFQRYEELSTLNGVLRYLVEHDIEFGMRSYSSERKGELEWHPANQSTLQHLLTNPLYSGVYAYGRRQLDPRKHKPGRRGTGRVSMPPKKWHAYLEQQVPAYISKEQFQDNLARLKANQNRAAQPGAVRKGAALLPGLLFCGECGHRMAVSYRKDSHTYSYRCCALVQSYGGDSCQQISGLVLDQFISQQLLSALQPTALEVSMAAATRLGQERADLHHIWQQRLERVTFETERAERHYLQVEPENRLVARQLGRDWETKLVAQQQLQADYEQFLRQRPHNLSADEQQAIRELAADIPALWVAPTTTPIQRKEIMRQLISKISIALEDQSERVQVSIDWVGGNRTSGVLIRPVGKYTQLSYYPQLCERIRELRAAGLAAKAISHQLNQEGFRPPKHTQSFKDYAVYELMRTLGLTHSAIAPPSSVELATHEWWFKDLAQALEMPVSTLSSWKRRGKLQARRVSSVDRRWIIWADETDLERLRQYRHRSLKDEARQYWLQRQQYQDPSQSLS